MDKNTYNKLEQRLAEIAEQESAALERLDAAARAVDPEAYAKALKERASLLEQYWELRNKLDSAILNARVH